MENFPDDGQSPSKCNENIYVVEVSVPNGEISVYIFAFQPNEPRQATTTNDNAAVSPTVEYRNNLRKNDIVYLKNQIIVLTKKYDLLENRKEHWKREYCASQEKLNTEKTKQNELLEKLNELDANLHKIMNSLSK